MGVLRAAGPQREDSAAGLRESGADVYSADADAGGVLAREQQPRLTTTTSILSLSVSFSFFLSLSLALLSLCLSASVCVCVCACVWLSLFLCVTHTHVYMRCLFVCVCAHVSACSCVCGCVARQQAMGAQVKHELLDAYPLFAEDPTKYPDYPDEVSQHSSPTQQS